MNRKEIRALAAGQFGDPTKIDDSRTEASGSDHCNGAQDALRRFQGLAKTEAKVKQQYGVQWDSMDIAERERAMVMSLYGCQHHARNIGFGRGHKAVEEHMRGLLKDDVQKLKEKGIQCVNGKVDMALRSVFKFFGNTTLMNFLSVGKEFRKWVADHPDYKDDHFQDCGRCDLGNRQDGISEHCFKMQTRSKKMLEFISEFHWDGYEIVFNRLAYHHVLVVSSCKSYFW